jgi:hypothetical protein
MFILAGDTESSCSSSEVSVALDALVMIRRGTSMTSSSSNSNRSTCSLCLISAPIERIKSSPIISVDVYCQIQEKSA